MSNSASVLSFTNDRTEPMVVWVEPWGEELSLPPKSTVQFKAPDGREVGDLELAQYQITLWAKGELVQVFIDDVLQETASASVAAPPELTKAMLHTLFDGEPSARLGGRPIPSAPGSST